MSNVFGKSKFGGNKRNWFKLKDGDSVYRILPPMGELAEEGRWSAFYRIHYGYKNSKGEMRTFQSPLVKNGKTKMIEVPDAALERIESLMVKLDEAKKAKNEDLVQQLLKLVGGQKSRYNLDSNHYMNVVDTQGNIGILKIRHKCKLALDKAIDDLRKDGVEGGGLDSDNGRFFVFGRRGTNRDTVYTVSVFKEKFDVATVGKVERDVVHVIDEEFARRCVVVNKNGGYTYKEAANLLTLFKKPTAEQVKRFVVEGEKAIDEILDAKAATAAVDSGEDDSGAEDDEPVATATKVKPMSAAAFTTTTETHLTKETMEVLAKATTPNVTGTVTVAAEAAQTAKAIADVKQTAQVAKTATNAPKTTAESIADMTPEEFLKSLEA